MSHLTKLEVVLIRMDGSDWTQEFTDEFIEAFFAFLYQHGLSAGILTKKPDTERDTELNYNPTGDEDGGECC